ncbi:MAG: hypothetical protein KGJ89_02770 [Patescibacteria group bacterium]|nr:hypothetical protein [Patescibacteria group bacterium]MDE2015527.1 hypothetical protein [Patescibacteria group bacterium]MDE2226857.1 hypothetical protein [Patescibacteria group bacterium]
MKQQSKWREFADNPRYWVEDLGRPAVFLIPIRKLNKKIGGKTVKSIVYDFLIQRFNACTIPKSTVTGFWKDSSGEIHKDVCRVYEVSFLGKQRIPFLLERLAEVASAIHEKGIYVKAGQYTCVVYPRDKKPR